MTRKGRVTYIPKVLIEEIKERSRDIDFVPHQNSIIINDIVKDAKIGKEIKRMAKVWGIVIK